MGIEKPEIKSELQLEQFQKTLQSFEFLISSLAQNIKNHKYDIIIGDDTSGRLVTLTIGGLIKKIYTKDNKQPPKILFIQGYRGEDEKELYEDRLDRYIKYLIDKEQIKPKSKILLLTEYIFDGDTINRFLNILSQNNLSPDIGTLESAQPPKNTYTLLKKNLNKEQLYIGSVIKESKRWYTPPFYNQEEIQGVKKDYGSTTAFPYRLENSQILKARQDVKTMIDHLEKYYNEHIHK